MAVHHIIALVMQFCFGLGAIDYILDGRFGLGREFENGLLASGRLMLCMGGFMVLAPFLAQFLGPAVSPLFRAIGADPSILAGMLLANDAGGAMMAMELADSTQAGQFSGLIVGSMLGTTVMLTIPTVISVTAKENLSSAIYGILCGILAIPFGCLAGGFTAGFSAKLVVFNTLPVLALSLVLLIVLLIFQEAVIPAFCIFGKLLTIVSTLGLVLGAVEYFLGLKLLPGLGNLEEAFPVVGGIAVYLAGALVLMNITGRVLAVPLQAVAHRLGVNTASVSALILTLANPIPTILMNREMDPKGRVLNIALVVTAGCVLGDHLAFTAQVAPELCVSVIVGKVVAGAIAFCASLLLARRLLD